MNISKGPLLLVLIKFLCEGRVRGRDVRVKVYDIIDVKLVIEVTRESQRVQQLLLATVSYSQQ